MSILALIFDYDDTLVPDSTTQLLNHFNIDPKIFWNVEFKRLVEKGFCPTHAYLNLILEKIGEDKPLGLLANNELREFGATVASTQYPGLHSLTRALKKQVQTYADIDIEFYIISSGLEEIIKGNEFVRKNFKHVYGCRLAGEEDNSVLKYIQRAITFTEKTRYLFEINKGIEPEESYKDPSAVNRNVKFDKRRIPFENMIYVGDGLTDIPCFSLLKQMRGLSFGIHHTEKTASDKIIIFKEILQTSRVVGTYSPRYGKSDTLGDLLRLKVESRSAEILLERKSSGRRN